MHMNMDLGPVANEIEKLKNYISLLVERSEHNRDDQYY